MVNTTRNRDDSFLRKVSLLIVSIGMLFSSLGLGIPVSWAKEEEPVPLDLTLSVGPDPAKDIDGAVIIVLVEAGGTPIEGVEVLLQSSVIEDYAGFEDDGSPTTLASSITVTTDSHGRATASWGLTACLLSPLSLTINAKAHKDEYADASASKTITVLHHTAVNLPPHGTETIYYDVSTHKTFVSVGPSEGSVRVGDTIDLQIEVGREINYTNLDLWNLPVIKGRGAVVLSIPKVNGVPVGLVVSDNVVTEAYLQHYSDDWLPISEIEDFGRLVEQVEWLQLINAVAGLNVIEIGLELVPDLVYFLGDLLYGVGQGPRGSEFDPNDQTVSLDPMLWDLEKFGVDAVRMTIPIQFDIEGYHEISWFANWQYYTGNQYVENDAGAQSQVAFYVAPDSTPSHNARLVGQSGVSLLEPGEDTFVHFDVQNTGDVTWIPGQELLLENTNDETLGALPAYALQNAVLPGRVARWEIPVTAPDELGVYGSEWQMTYRGAPFGPVMLCLIVVITVPEGEVDFDPLGLLEEWFNDLIEQISAEINEFLENLKRELEELLQRELERLWHEFWEDLFRQFCGTSAIAPAVLLLGAWSINRRRRGRARCNDGHD